MTRTTPAPAEIVHFGALFDDLGADARRVLLAGLLCAELDTTLAEPLGLSRDQVAQAIAAAQGAGLLSPQAQQALLALSPESLRDDVCHRLTEHRLRQGLRLLPLVRTMHSLRITPRQFAPAFETAASEALETEPALAAELFGALTSDGDSLRHAEAAALSGDLDTALRVADRILSDEDSPDRPEAAALAATALAHRGQLLRSSELYQWSGLAWTKAFAAIGFAASGHQARLDEPFGGPPTLMNNAALMMARGMRETLTGLPTAALSEFSQAATLLEPSGRTAILPDSPAALAALVSLHSGELEIGESILERADATGLGSTLMTPRHRLLHAWILMTRGNTAAAAQKLEAAARETHFEARDLLLATTLTLGIARRNSDLPGMQRAWPQACEALVRTSLDVFALLPLGELIVAAARLGEHDRVQAQAAEAQRLLGRLGDPPLWTVLWHWSNLHGAVIREDADAVATHLAALRTSRDTRFGAVLAEAAECWSQMSAGSAPDPSQAEAAARGLHAVGMTWDAAKLAGQAAIRTLDRRAMTVLLDCARMLQGRPAPRASADPSGPAPEGRLSAREQEVADLILAGHTYKQIASRLFISAKTVEHHVARIRQRLNCGSRSEMLARLRAMSGH